MEASPYRLSRCSLEHDVGTGFIYQDANIKVAAVENSHFHFHTGNEVGKHKSYAYRFETSDRVIVFTGDTGPSDAVTELAKGADLLVTQTSSFKDRMQMMIDNGRWQKMTPTEQARLLAQSKRNITLEAAQGFSQASASHLRGGPAGECADGPPPAVSAPCPTGTFVRQVLEDRDEPIA